jgi:hypothetical protein
MAFKSVFDKSFKYRNALSTDIRQTFERARREQRLQEHRSEPPSGDRPGKVVATIGRTRRPA